MGLRFGQSIPLDSQSGASRAAKLRNARFSSVPEKGDVRPGQERETTVPQEAGFGKNTLSPPGAALITLGRGLKEARRLVPTTEELREQLRSRKAQDEANRQEAQASRAAAPAERTGSEAPRRIESFRPEAAPQAIAFAQAAQAAAPTRPEIVETGTVPSVPRGTVTTQGLDVLI